MIPQKSSNKMLAKLSFHFIYIIHIYITCFIRVVLSKFNTVESISLFNILTWKLMYLRRAKEPLYLFSFMLFGWSTRVTYMPYLTNTYEYLRSLSSSLQVITHFYSSTFGMELFTARRGVHLKLLETIYNRSW